MAAEASDNTLASADLIWLLSDVCAASALDKTAALCDASEAAAPESVWPATSDEMIEAAFEAAAAFAALAAAAIDLALSVAAGPAGPAATRALRPVRMKSETRIFDIRVKTVAGGVV